MKATLLRQCQVKRVLKRPGVLTRFSLVHDFRQIPKRLTVAV